jgi:hypothetical protein
VTPVQKKTLETIRNAGQHGVSVWTIVDGKRRRAFSSSTINTLFRYGHITIEQRSNRTECATYYRALS